MKRHNTARDEAQQLVFTYQEYLNYGQRYLLWALAYALLLPVVFYAYGFHESNSTFMRFVFFKAPQMVGSLYLVGAFANFGAAGLFYFRFRKAMQRLQVAEKRSFEA